jgi:hypothetical protein
MTLILLSNIYSSATTPMGYDTAALSLGLPYEKFSFMNPAPSAAQLKMCTGTFQFGPDFCQANASDTDRERSRVVTPLAFG